MEILSMIPKIICHVAIDMFLLSVCCMVGRLFVSEIKKFIKTVKGDDND